MNDIYGLMTSRRSVRQFTQRDILTEVLDKILGAALQAPNAHNRQTWRFVVLADDGKRKEFVEVMSGDYRTALLAEGMEVEKAEARVAKRAKRMKDAPTAVVVCVDEGEFDAYDDPMRQEGEYLMAVQSAAMAGDHLLLAAHSEGLGGVWMCAPLFVQEKVRAVLALPDTWRAQGLVLLGYPEDDRPKKPRRDLEDVVVYK